MRFCTVGASGYAVNLAVYTMLVAQRAHPAVAVVGSFVVALNTNYVLHRIWTFRVRRAIAGQGARFLAVSLAALAANEIALGSLLDAGLGKVVAESLACIIAIPVSYAGNRLWAFRPVQLQG
jgi:putative flippase GtrA